MKYLKTFEDNRNDVDYFGKSLAILHPFLKDIEDLSYILEDEGYDVIVDLNRNKHIWIIIEYKSDNDIYKNSNGFSRNKKEEGIGSEEEYLEYYDRLEDVCKKHGYELKKYNQNSNLLVINCS